MLPHLPAFDLCVFEQPGYGTKELPILRTFQDVGKVLFREGNSESRQQLLARKWHVEGCASPECHSRLKIAGSTEIWGGPVGGMTTRTLSQPPARPSLSGPIFSDSAHQLFNLIWTVSRK
jgi:hypothetical protein